MSYYLAVCECSSQLRVNIFRIDDYAEEMQMSMFPQNLKD